METGEDITMETGEIEAENEAEQEPEQEPEADQEQEANVNQTAAMKRTEQASLCNQFGMA